MNSLTGQFPIRVQRHNSACESNSAVSFFDRVSPKILTTSSAQPTFVRATYRTFIN